MFLTCLLNSRPPAFKRSSFGIPFHCFAAKYLKEFNPCFVVFTLGSDSVLLPLKSYLLFLILIKMLNSNGPSMLPCGTPADILNQLEMVITK